MRRLVSAAGAVAYGEHPPERPQTGALAPAVGLAIASDRARPLKRATHDRQHEIGSTEDQREAAHD